MIIPNQKKLSISSTIFRGFLFFLLNILILCIVNISLLILSAYWSVKYPELDEELGMFGVPIILFFCVTPVLSIICGIIETISAQKIWGFNAVELIIFFVVTQLSFVLLAIML